MSLSMYQVSVPVYVRGLRVLSAILKKAVAHAEAEGASVDAWLEARLAPDMLPLAGQVQRASDTAKLAVARLAGVVPPSFEDDETTMEQLDERIRKTIAYLVAIEPAQLAGAETRTVSLDFGALKPVFRGDGYITGFALPNFFFHVTTAYNILRNGGVRLGKLDYLGHYEAP